MKNPFSRFEKTIHKKEDVLPDDHWFAITKKLYENQGEKPAPLQIRAQALIDAFGIPSGQVSALGTDTENNRVEIEKDKIIAELLTNKAGVVIDKEKGIVSCDLRDMYPEGLPVSLEKSLDPKTVGIINTMYKSATTTYERFGDTEDTLKSEQPLNYFRLPGGVDLLLFGYTHHRDWHSRHQEFLTKIGEYNPSVVGIEGFATRTPGTSLKRIWENNSTGKQSGHYDTLMKQMVERGFTGLFTEVDMRDTSMISMDSQYLFEERVFAPLPEDFFKKYFAFLEKEQPQLAHKIGSHEGLKVALQKQSSTTKGLFNRVDVEYKEGKRHYAHHYLKEEDMSPTSTPTSLELGQFIFTDALAALKLHMTAKLMADGHIPKGPIVDFEGACHIPSKSFFIRNPEYAAEITLRTINELMAGGVKEKGNIKEIYDVLDTPNWTEIVKEIARLHFSKVDVTQGTSASSGQHQYPIDYVPVDFLKTYSIDPAKVMPSDEKIRNMTKILIESKKE